MNYDLVRIVWFICFLFRLFSLCLGTNFTILWNFTFLFLCWHLFNGNTFDIWSKPLLFLLAQLLFDSFLSTILILLSDEIILNFCIVIIFFLEKFSWVLNTLSILRSLDYVFKNLGNFRGRRYEFHTQLYISVIGIMHFPHYLAYFWFGIDWWFN